MSPDSNMGMFIQDFTTMIEESIMGRCTRQLPYLKDLSYEDCLRMLKLPTLSYHQWRGGFIEVYKMLHGFYDKETTSFIKLWTEVAEK